MRFQIDVLDVGDILRTADVERAAKAAREVRDAFAAMPAPHDDAARVAAWCGALAAWATVIADDSPSNVAAVAQAMRAASSAYHHGAETWQIVLAWLEDDCVVVRERATDLGERPELAWHKVARTALWLASGVQVDVDKAKAYAAKNDREVYCYPPTTPDPCGQAAQDILAAWQARQTVPKAARGGKSRGTRSARATRHDR